ncbi:acetyl-CoA carboxylase biotin carboxyl carrier protein subunit [Flavobacteriaceae bacterium TP-CH-4]|uniref:Acetyl-CoA carboxylase biotin carboxyl carrier protein subunit n=1 Tax=Pelagihabitans pacificus TaxID=2696054 RepID=A0A967AXU6_9FLAO|nr:acetyl-CoA carboxylase biotin carboxyl carrier protein subunit [Pelagihabitans pacificus]NHF61138.1 acetyl-CoA carboxylase biotin carboxyl carrier protein subunit [Pelagihabitans pacificus]
MDTTFKVTVNESLSFDITQEDLSQMDALQISDDSYHILQDHKPFSVELINTDFNRKRYVLKVNNNSYSVDILGGLDMLIDEMGFSLASSKNITSISAPMPGLILEINVTKGQEVHEDDPLLILEAMKMENIITSPRNGTIKSIAVNQGDTVDKKNLLIEFE